MALIQGPATRLLNAVLTSGDNPTKFLGALGKDATLVSIYPTAWAMLCALRQGMDTEHVLPACKRWVSDMAGQDLPISENNPMEFAKGLVEEKLPELPGPITLALELGEIMELPILFGGVFSLQGGASVVVPWDTRLMEPTAEFTMFPMRMYQDVSEGTFKSRAPLDWNKMQRQLTNSEIPMDGGLGSSYPIRVGSKSGFYTMAGDKSKRSMSATSHVATVEFENTMASRTSYAQLGSGWTRSQRGLIHSSTPKGGIFISHWSHTDLQRETDGSPVPSVPHFYFVPKGVLEVYLPKGTRHIESFQAANFWALGSAAFDVLMGDATVQDIEVVGEGQVRELRSDKRGPYLHAEVRGDTMNGVFTGRSLVPVNEDITAMWEVTMLQGPRVRFWPLSDDLLAPTRRYIAQKAGVPINLLG